MGAIFKLRTLFSVFWM